MYVYIYSSDMDIYKNYTVIMKIIIYSVDISSPMGEVPMVVCSRAAFQHQQKLCQKCVDFVEWVHSKVIYSVVLSQPF